MKTFSDYFIEFIKILAFGLVLAWLCSSCGSRKQSTIELLHAYRDSMGVNNLKLGALVDSVEKWRNNYEREYPPLRFMPGESTIQREYSQREHEAYKKLVSKLESIKLQKTILDVNHMRYKIIIDSLKEELYN